MQVWMHLLRHPACAPADVPGLPAAARVLLREDFTASTVRARPWRLSALCALRFP
jgi:hypothetical protein